MPKLYNSSSGMKTTEWGPAGWKYLFMSIMGGYPYLLDNSNNEHKRIKKSFYYQFAGLQYTLPCIYCRRSYKQYFKELPISSFMNSRLELMYWLYLIKDKVNQKLIEQESECYRNEKRKLDKLYSASKLTQSKYKKELKKIQKENLITKPSPPFKEVLDFYESFRAGCSKTAQTCK
jgi:hypothetical protein